MIARQRLFEIANGQAGFFTVKQSLSAGYDRKNIAYHVQQGSWERVGRGIYRLTEYPQPDRPDLMIWFLWSRGRDDLPQGVYCRQTALTIYDLSDAMPAHLHMTVPKQFRRNAKIPAILCLYREDLCTNDIQLRDGIHVTSPLRTLIDIICDGALADELVEQGVTEALERGLIISKAQLKDRLVKRSLERLTPWMRGFLDV